jgi:glycosyltransferase involved in cell wall biosynthesis
LNQTYGDFEIIIAGNTGIKAATGDVIAHLDSDDLWKPEMLSSLIDVLNRHPLIGAVFYDVGLFA